MGKQIGGPWARQAWGLGRYQADVYGGVKEITRLKIDKKEIKKY